MPSTCALQVPAYVVRSPRWSRRRLVELAHQPAGWFMCGRSTVLDEVATSDRPRRRWTDNRSPRPGSPLIPRSLVLAGSGIQGEAAPGRCSSWNEFGPASHRLVVPRAVWVVLLWVVYLLTWALGHGSEIHTSSLGRRSYLSWWGPGFTAGRWLFPRPPCSSRYRWFSFFTDRSMSAGNWSAGGRGWSVNVAIVIIAFLTGFASDTNRRLKRMVQAQASIVAAVSHEVRTPLTAVLGIAQELNASWESIPDETRRELVGLVAEQAADMTTIVEDLLTSRQGGAGQARDRPADGRSCLVVPSR